MLRASAELSRYSTARLALFAGVFLFLAPVYWTAVQRPWATETPPSATGARALQTRIECLLRAEIPQWDDTRLTGVPLIADPSHGLFQPLNLVFALLPPSPAIAWYASLSFFFMGFFFALFLRSLGVRYASALAGGLAYACSGLAAGAMLNPQSMAALVWTPIVFWSINEFGFTFQLREAAMAGVAMAMLLLSGSLAIALPVSVLALFYGVVLGLMPSSGDLPALERRFMNLGILAAVGAGLTAFQWLPALLWASQLSNPLSVLLFADVSIAAPRDGYEFLSQTVAAAGIESQAPAYVGILVLPLLLPALFFVPRQPAFFFAAAALAAACAAITGPALARFALPVWTASACVLAGLGLDTVMAPGRDFRSPRIWAPLLMFLACSAVFIFMGTAAIAGKLALGTAVVSLAAIFRSRYISSTLAIAFTTLLLFDLGAANSQTGRERFSRAQSPLAAPVLAAAKEYAGQSRVLDLREDAAAFFPDSTAIHRGLTASDVLRHATIEQEPWWTALFGQSPSSIDTFAAWPHPELLNHLAVAVILVPEGGTLPAEWKAARIALEIESLTDDAILYRNGSALPRAYWAPRWRRAPDAKTATNMILESGFAPGSECVVEGTTRDPDTSVNRSDLAMTPCALEPAPSSHVRTIVDAPADGIVVLADAFAPGWHATVDGRPVEILRVNGLFRGVSVPRGKHLVLFRYVAPGWFAGLAVSAITLLALAGGMFRSQRKRS